MNASEIDTIEVDLLLEAIRRRYGYDFGAYARSSIERRVAQFVASSGHASAAALIDSVLRDETLLSRLVQHISIPVTEMFRDPFVYRALRQEVVPRLRSFPYLKVWHAGCATGEEVFSLAIVLREEGLYGRATIYATDLNDAALARAKEGILSLDRIQEWTRSYQEAGGRASFSEYYHAQYDAAALDRALFERITFANHNLASDGSFGEMHLILCRNVLIYFGRELQERALRLCSESLVHGGFLCLGSKEDLRFSAVRGEYRVVDARARIYKKDETLRAGEAAAEPRPGAAGS